MTLSAYPTTSASSSPGRQNLPQSRCFLSLPPQWPNLVGACNCCRRHDGCIPSKSSR